MKIAIVEDELLTAEDLAEMLLQLPYEIEVVAILSSVTEAVAYFNQHPPPDLIFCDIELGDGHSFEIFKQTTLDVPVIFCTAYQEYALEAFKNNGIDYLLKPASHNHLNGAMLKFNRLRAKFSTTYIDYDGIVRSLQAGINQGRQASSLLINFKDKIIPVKISEIALFGIDHKMTQLVTFSNQKYFVNQTLDELELICGVSFYRANRQYLINKEAVAEVLQYFARKLVVKLKIEGKHEIIISKTKVPEFLNWLKK